MGSHSWAPTRGTTHHRESFPRSAITICLGPSLLLRRRHPLERAAGAAGASTKSTTDSRSAGTSARDGAPSLLPEHLDDLLHRRCVFRSLVRPAKRDDAWKAQRVPWPVPHLAGGVIRSGGDLVGEHLDHDLRLQPHVRGEERSDAGGPLLHLELVRTLVDLAPPCVGQARADLG